MDMKYVRLDIYVIDYNLLSQNDVLGVLHGQLGEDVPMLISNSGRERDR